MSLNTWPNQREQRGLDTSLAKRAINERIAVLKS